MTQVVELPDGHRASCQATGDGVPALILPGGPGFEAGYLAGDAELFADVLSSYLVDPPKRSSNSSAVWRKPADSRREAKHGKR